MEKLKIYIGIAIGCLILTGCQNESRKIQNIETFAKIYGYARWFHPSDEAQDISWNRLAILGVQKVENIKTDSELQDTLVSLFSPIIQGLQVFRTDQHKALDSTALIPSDLTGYTVIAWQHYGVELGENSNIYKSIRTNKVQNNARFGEIIQEPIGSNLSCIIPLALYKSNSGTFPNSDIIFLKSLQKELSNIEITSSFNPAINLGSVVIAWNVFQHFYPYFDVIGASWDKVLTQTLEETLSNRDKVEFFVTLSEMVAKLEDGHGVVSGQEIYNLPIRTEWIENNIVITASNSPQLLIGDIITEVNGKDAYEVLQNTERMISGSPQLKKHRALNIFGSQFIIEKTELTVEREGNKVLCEVQNRSGIKSMFFNPIGRLSCRWTDFKEILPGIFYLNLKNCTSEDYSARIQELAEAKSIIYDYRWGGMLSLGELIPHLVDTSVNSAWWNIPQIIYPDRKDLTFIKNNWSLDPKVPYFNSKTVIITAPSVVSTGETWMGIIDHYNLATTVGGTTAGCNGNANYIYLPCGYRIMWTGMKVLKHDESQHHLIGFVPDYPAKRTLEGVKEGRDEVLEKAIEIAKAPLTATR